MTTSLRESMLEAVSSALMNVTDAGTRVYRTRQMPTVVDNQPAVLILPYKEESDPAKSGHYVSRTFEIRISVFARGDIADQAADSVCSQVHAALMADETLGGLAMRCSPLETEWNFSDEDMDAVEVDCRYQIMYTTRRASLTLRP